MKSYYQKLSEIGITMEKWIPQQIKKHEPSIDKLDDEEKNKYLHENGYAIVGHQNEKEGLQRFDFMKNNKTLESITFDMSDFKKIKSEGN